jgi:hypothetical protein
MTLKTSTFALTLSAAALTAAPAFAITNLVQNGDFTANTGNGQIDFNSTVADWHALGAPFNNYTFVFNPGPGVSGTTADTTGALGNKGFVLLWGPGSGSNNGLTVSPAPDGGAFIGQDPAFENGGGGGVPGDIIGGSVVQTINGLTIGKTYDVTFDYAIAQQHGFSGPTNGGWRVSMGGSLIGATLPAVQIGSHDFSGWLTASYDFVATNTSEVLSFNSFCSLADPGCAQVVPPFALLDSVAINVPEPSTWAMMLAGFAGLGYAGFRAHRRKPEAIV